MKKILLLGGSAQQIIAIETAKKLGYRTIICDYLMDNPGQYVADKFYLVSTTDKEAVLEIAKREQISGILAYASDPAAPTAAYVAEVLGLPTNPYLAVETLCNKDKFRSFLRNNGFNAPQADGYSSMNDAVNNIKEYRLPIIIKPVDSSGSKGATVLHELKNVEKSIEFAFSFSRNHRIIIEEYIEKKHRYLIGGDIFVKNGEIILWGLLNCHRDEKVNLLVPVGKSFPLELDQKDIDSAKETLQRMVNKLHIHSGAMNVELIIDKNNHVWLIDVGPRNGGNMIPDLLGMIYDVDIVEMTIRTAMGEDVTCFPEKKEVFYATHNLHTDTDGIYDGIIFSDEIQERIVRKSIYKKKGDRVEFFDNASKAIGIVFLNFENRENMIDILRNINKHIKIQVRTELLIIHAKKSEDKLQAMRECDMAFDLPVLQRKIFPSLFLKIEYSY